MDPITIAILGIVAMFVLIVLRVPIGIAMAVVGVAGYGILSGFAPALTILGTEASSAMANVDLAVIPLFLLMGNFATSAGLSSDIYNLAYAFVGHRRGGLALSTIGGCGFFGAICGSSTATAATFGRIALPEMLSRGYSRRLATGCIAAGGTLGSLVPPSVIIVIYAVAAEEFIIELFKAAVIPAILQIILYFVAIMVTVRLDPSAGPAGPRMSWLERFRILIKSWGAVLILVGVIGGIYGGVFTVTEAAAFGASATFIFALGRRRLTKEAFWEALTGTAVTTAFIYVIIIGANVFTYFIALSRMPDTMVTAISGLHASKFVILAILLLLYLILGSIFDSVSAMLITLPFVLPLITQLGYSPVWWGIINVVVIEIGMITPPIGLNVFVLQGVAPDIPLKSIFRGIMPFFYVDVFRLVALTVFPWLTLWLPSVLR
ncbi:MAG: TRAP transporter large permease [Deltaproteobacteria bacterium]|nr:TRAP transporter large permease [Deltaproteobacteria bacterium]